MPVPRNRFPSLVSIEGSSGHACGGIAITPKLILTAAHCLDDVGPNPVVHVGINHEDAKVMWGPKRNVAIWHFCFYYI